MGKISYHYKRKIPPSLPQQKICENDALPSCHRYSQLSTGDDHQKYHKFFASEYQNEPPHGLQEPCAIPLDFFWQSVFVLPRETCDYY